MWKQGSLPAGCSRGPCGPVQELCLLAQEHPRLQPQEPRRPGDMQGAPPRKGRRWEACQVALGQSHGCPSREGRCKGPKLLS